MLCISYFSNFCDEIDNKSNLTGGGGGVYFGSWFEGAVSLTWPGKDGVGIGGSWVH